MDFLRKGYNRLLRTEDGEKKTEGQNGCDQESSNDEADDSNDFLYEYTFFIENTNSLYFIVSLIYEQNAITALIQLRHTN